MSAPEGQIAPAPDGTDHGLIRTVLVVDDSGSQRRMVAGALSRRGYRVVEAADGIDALTVLEEEDVDVVLSDWMMPGMDGLELCRRIRERDGPYVYFILLTSKDEKQAVARGLDVGADDFLSKPVHPEELRARIVAGERLIAAQTALYQRNAELSGALTCLQEAHERIHQDLEQARRLQTSLVPEWERPFDQGHASLLLRPCGHVGGDLVGLFPISPREVGLFALDVSGHGIASALMTARLASFLTQTSPEHNVALATDDDGRVVMRPPHEVCADLNRLILSDGGGLYFTMILAHADLTRGEVTFCQAGHPYPVIQDAEGSIRRLRVTGLPIGLFDEAAYESVTVELSPGERILFHSDGITEAADPFGVQAGDTGLDELLMRLGPLKGRELLDQLVGDLGRWIKDGDFYDDISAVLLEWDGPPEDDPSPAGPSEDAAGVA